MRSAGFAKFQVSLNLSRAQLLDPGLIAAVRSSLERTGLPPDLLCFEVPEAVVLGSSRTAAIARELADAGVGLILDDFWAIAPDLLAGLPPIQSVKVDLNVAAGGRLDADIDRVASIARARRVPLVAKRVGSAEQLAFALEIGCEFFQGDGVSATVPAQDLVREAQTAALLFGAGAGPAPFFQDEEPAAA